MTFTQLRPAVAIEQYQYENVKFDEEVGVCLKLGAFAALLYALLFLSFFRSIDKIQMRIFSIYQFALAWTLLYFYFNNPVRAASPNMFFGVGLFHYMISYGFYYYSNFIQIKLPTTVSPDATKTTSNTKTKKEN